jgi:hypothetical protein
VKQKFLDIKAKVDVMVRQNASLNKERFGAALLGNPGTGRINSKSSLIATDQYPQGRPLSHGFMRNSYARLERFLGTNSWRLLDLVLPTMGSMFARST